MGKLSKKADPSLFLFPPDTVEGGDRSLKEVRAVTMRGAERGTICPCCGQFVKLYKRKLNSAMAHALIRIHKHFRRNPDLNWLHVPDFLRDHKIARADEAKLVLWGLLQGSGEMREDGSKRSGFYKLTDLGQRFVMREERVPKYVYIYNQTVYGFSDGSHWPRELTDVGDALGDHFNYAELMKDV